MDITDKFYKFYNLRLYRKQTSDKIPAAHQREALEKLHEWFKEKRSTHSGGILVLPTGGGKTFTTVRFLCTYPLSQNYKVLWLAHTHHLLEQAFYTFEPEVKHISLPKTRLDVRVVSGTPGHCSINEIGIRDDVLIGTLQTLTSAYKRKEPKLEAFLEAAGDQLFVVFDEAHHSPSPTYRKLIMALQQRFPKMYLLGLTATPTYSIRDKYGWLEKLFPQRIIYQVTAQRLMADGILSKPEIEQHQTNFEVPEFDEEEYNKWVKSYQELPENIIDKLAEDRDRNLFIAETYAINRERYGKTLIFADRWFQCEQLREFLDSRGVRAGVVYSDSKSSESHKVRNRDENARILETFRRNELDVLINVKMLTEGTDVPDVQTVFLTRETKSEILLTQMVGRALRGPKMGGTEKAYIVAFIDIWNYEIKWAGYNQILPGFAYDDESQNSASSRRTILADLVRRLAQQMDRAIDTINEPFLTLLPLGWYQVKFETVIEGSEDDEFISELVMVFQGEKEGYERFIENIIQLEIPEFAEPDINFNDNCELIRELCIKAFYEEDRTAEAVGEWTNESLLINLFNIVRHVAQNEREKPPFFLFEERNNHDLDALAQNFINQDLGPRALEETLKSEFSREDRYWKTIYNSYELFKQHYNACVDRILAKENPKSAVTERCLPGEFPTVLRDHNLLEVENDTRKPKVWNLVKIENDPLKSKADNLVNQTEKHKPFAVLPIPEDVHSVEQWKDFICHSLDLFYRCNAVHSFRCWNSYWWQILLNDGIDANQIRPHLRVLMQKIEEVLINAGYLPPEKIFINSEVCVRRKSVNWLDPKVLKLNLLPSSKTEWEWIWKPILDSIGDIGDTAVGDKIIVLSGPFKDFEGEVIEIIHDRKHIKAMLSIFGRDTPVELELNQVAKQDLGDLGTTK
jgi:superfamily II DNA or RNA helicase